MYRTAVELANVIENECYKKMFFNKMHKSITIGTAVLLCIFLAACGQPVELSKEQKAAALLWLGLVDKNEYEESWQQASTIFQYAVIEIDWVKQIRAARAPLGAVLSRNQEESVSQKNPSGAPDGDYIVVKYESSFDKKAEVVETLTLYLESDGSWRTTGYFIK